MRALIILAILLVIMLAGTCSAAAAAPAVPLSVGVDAGGATFCRSGPAPVGRYSAKHCAVYPHLRADAAWTAYSVDPSRDLLHFAGPAHAEITMRAPAGGDMAEWRNERAAGTLRFYGVRYMVGEGPGELDSGDYGVWCRQSGAEIYYGDSGTAAYVPVPDGTWALVGVVAGADIRATILSDIFCNGWQAVFTVSVP